MPETSLYQNLAFRTIRYGYRRCRLRPPAEVVVHQAGTGQEHCNPDKPDADGRGGGPDTGCLDAHVILFGL